MALKLSQLAAKTAPLRIWFDEESFIDIEYLPNKITDELILGWQEAAKKGDDNAVEFLESRLESNNDPLVTLIKSWDLLEDDDVTVVPLTQAGLRRVPNPVKGRIMRAIMEEIQAQGEVKATRTRR
jgi:hypothetical protein